MSFFQTWALFPLFCLILSRKLLSFITVVLTLSPFKLHLSRIFQTVRWQLPHLSSHSAAPSTEVPAEYTPATAHHLSPVAEPRQQRPQQQCPPKQPGGDQSWTDQVTVNSCSPRHSQCQIAEPLLLWRLRSLSKRPQQAPKVAGKRTDVLSRAADEGHRGISPSACRCPDWPALNAQHAHQSVGVHWAAAAGQHFCTSGRLLLLLHLWSHLQSISADDGRQHARQEAPFQRQHGRSRHWEGAARPQWGSVATAAATAAQPKQQQLSTFHHHHYFTTCSIRFHERQSLLSLFLFSSQSTGDCGQRVLHSWSESVRQPVGKANRANCDGDDQTIAQKLTSPVLCCQSKRGKVDAKHAKHYWLNNFYWLWSQIPYYLIIC